jgi:hypothetical protein
MFGLKQWIHDYNHDMCGMMSYTISDKKFVTDNIRVRLVLYSTHTYLYLYLRTSVFISEAIRIRIRIRIKYENKYDFSDICLYSIRLYP